MAVPGLEGALCQVLTALHIYSYFFPERDEASLYKFLYVNVKLVLPGRVFRKDPSYVSRKEYLLKKVDIGDSLSDNGVSQVLRSLQESVSSFLHLEAMPLKTLRGDHLIKRKKKKDSQLGKQAGKVQQRHTYQV